MTLIETATYGTLTYVADPSERPIYGDKVDGPFWELKAAPHVMIKVKRLFPRVRQQRTGAVSVRDTPEVARDLTMLLTRYAFDIDEASRARLEARTEQHIALERDVAQILQAGEYLALPDGAYEPMLDALGEIDPQMLEGQKVAATLAQRTRRLLLLDETGAGKTVSTLLAVVRPETMPATIVGPPHLLLQWQKVINLVYPMLRVHIVKNGTFYDPATKRDMKGHQPDVLLITYGMLRGWANHLAGRTKAAVFEEAHELRRGDSQKYDAAAVLAESASLRMGVTATPVFNYGDEIYNIVQIVAPDTLGTKDEFLREWCHPIGNGKHKVNDPKALGAFLRAEGVTLKRTLKELGIDLPGVRPILHAVDVDTKLLEKLTDQAVGMAETIVSRNATPFDLMRATRDFDAEIRHATGVAKAPHVATFCEMLLDSVDKLILFGWHRDVYKIWMQRLAAFNPVLYTGTESPSMKEISKARFLGGDELLKAYDHAKRVRSDADQLNWDESRVMIISLRSGSGMDGIQKVCHTAVQGELDWSYGPHHQGVGRLDRPGQQHSVLNYWLVSDYGTDPGMLETIDIKRQQADGIVDPDRDVFEPTEADPERIRKLAAEFLAKRRRAVAANTEQDALDLGAAA